MKLNPGHMGLRATYARCILHQPLWAPASRNFQMGAVAVLTPTWECLYLGALSPPCVSVTEYHRLGNLERPVIYLNRNSGGLEMQTC